MRFGKLLDVDAGLNPKKRRRGSRAQGGEIGWIDSVRYSVCKSEDAKPVWHRSQVQ